MNPLRLDAGAVVTHRGARYEIVGAVNLATLLARNLETLKIEHLPIAEVAPDDASLESNPAAHGRPSDPSLIPKALWDEANARFEIIKLLLQLQKRTRATVKARALECNRSVATLYRWIEAYEATGEILSLVRDARTDIGKGRVTPEIEAIISDVIQTHYLTEQRPSVESVIVKIRRHCKAAKLEPPHDNTVRNRIARLPDVLRAARRYGRKAAEQFEGKAGINTDGRWPNDIVQMDHILLDIELVDDEYRLPVGRPWLTALICTRTRIITSYHLSFERPGVDSVGLAISGAILPKEDFIRAHKIDAPWPVWGKMVTLYADNAGEFRAEELQRICANYGINLQWRPVAKPRYGAFVERYAGTLAKRLHELPGTTFSNIRERGEYDSQGKAVITFSAFERILATEILEVYHQSLHSGISTTPLAAWEHGLLGDDEQPGRGLPDRIIGADAERLRIGFMDAEYPTVQTDGLHLLTLTYYDAQVLRPWVGSRSSENPKKGRKFTVRYDPGDVTVVYFHDPDLNEFFPVGLRDATRPKGTTLWQVQAARKWLRDRGIKDVDENKVFRALEKIEEEVASEAAKTKSVRKIQQRAKNELKRAKPLRPAKATAAKQGKPSILPVVRFEGIDEGEIEAPVVVIKPVKRNT
jgi:putative transposase